MTDEERDDTAPIIAAVLDVPVERRMDALALACKFCIETWGSGER